MKHVTRILTAGLIGLSFAGAVAHAELDRGEIEQSDKGPMSMERLHASRVTLEVISLTGFASAGLVYDSAAQNALRILPRTSQVMAARGSDLAGKDGVTLTEQVLRGTEEGDVVRLHYVAGTAEALERAANKLVFASNVWDNRLASLTAERAPLESEVLTLRSVFTEFGVNEKPVELRVNALSRFDEASRRLRILDRLIEDAKMRKKNAHAQAEAARLNLRSTRNAGTGLVNQSYHITEDLLVNDRTKFDLRWFFANNMTSKSSAAARLAIPDFTISRVLSPNAATVSKSIGKMRGGLAVMAVTGALLVEEIFIGSVGDSVEKMRQEHYSPALRTDPAGDVTGNAAAGRRY